MDFATRIRVINNNSLKVISIIVKTRVFFFNSIK